MQGKLEAIAEEIRREMTAARHRGESSGLQTALQIVEREASNPQTPKRLDAVGRDVTESPGLWCDADMVHLVVELPAYRWEALKERAAALRITPEAAASLAVVQVLIAVSAIVRGR